MKPKKGQWFKYLQDGDLRSITAVDHLIPLIRGPDDFGNLFRYLYSEDRLIVMHAADAIEKISRHNSEYLDNYKNERV